VAPELTGKRPSRPAAFELSGNLALQSPQARLIRPARPPRLPHLVSTRHEPILRHARPLATFCTSRLCTSMRPCACQSRFTWMIFLPRPKSRPPTTRSTSPCPAPRRREAHAGGTLRREHRRHRATQHEVGREDHQRLQRRRRGLSAWTPTSTAPCCIQGECGARSGTPSPCLETRAL
jgi:hypothetical protein